MSDPSLQPGDPQGSGSITPSRGKEKKRVGFTNSHGGRDDQTLVENRVTATSYPDDDNDTRSDVDHEELTAALTRILQPTQPELTPVPPAQRGESERAAKERADRLAESVERSYSAPVSVRTSLDLAPSQEQATHATGREQLTAEQLVRAHSRRVPKSSNLSRDAFHYDAGLRSGQLTPTRHFDQEHEYVPPPNRYRGSILASLLSLYNKSGDGTGSGGSSTPGSQSTTPNASRRSSMVFGSSAPDLHSGTLAHRHGKYLGHKAGVSGLVEASSMLALPATKEVGHAVDEQLKKENGRPKMKRSRSSFFSVSSRSTAEEEIRITKHIADVLSRHRYIVKLCRALMMYGAPTHRLEDYLKMSARVLEIEAQFMYIPGCMLVSFDDASTHTAEVKLVRGPQGVDLGKLRDVHSIYKQVVHDFIHVDDATVKLENVMNRKDKFSPWLRVPVYGLASVCVAPFAFQGRFIDLPIAFLLGCIVGALALVAAPSSEFYANVFEVSAAVITSFLARAIGSIDGGRLFCFSALAQSSIALILPGYTVLCSSLELQSHNIVAGSVRLVYAMIYTLFLGYGITIGTTIYGVIDKGATSQTTCDNPLSRPWYFLFVPLFTICLCIINQAKWRQIPVMVGIAFAGFCVNTYASSYFSSNAQISNTLGALCVGVLANLYSRLGRHFERLMLALWYQHLVPGFSRAKRRNSDGGCCDADPVHPDLESNRSGHDPEKAVDRGSAEVIGYGLAAAAMLPAIWVQVPSGIAANGSLLGSIHAANQIAQNATAPSSQDSVELAFGNSVPFTVLFSVIQVAIAITVGLFLSALLVYPFGKRRSALFSF